MIASALGTLQRAVYVAERLGVTAVAFPLMHAWHKMLMPTLSPGKEASRELNRRYQEIIKRDLANVEAGWYPRELLSEFPAAKYLAQLPNGFVEFPRIAFRRAMKRYDDLPPVENRDAYPEYYLRNFHWQTDGWLSDRSARLYDVSVEVLFMGMADVMRRMIIPPIVRSLAGLEHPRILDVACGTGRTLHHLHAVLPASKLYGLDLSPNYLKRAHEVLADTGASLVAENAESMPFKDESFEAVTSVFLFHELPKDARRNVMREMFRVVRPGGTVVICDSAQIEESAALRTFLDGFPAIYHEPYYRGYLSDSLGLALAECGFEVSSSDAHFLSKVVVARRPT